MKTATAPSFEAILDRMKNWINLFNKFVSMYLQISEMLI